MFNQKQVVYKEAVLELVSTLACGLKIKCLLQTCWQIFSKRVWN